MRYLFRGTLAGFLCEECAEPLAGVTLRLYRAETRPDLVTHAVAHPKDTFAPLSPEEVAAKAGRLLAEVVIDERGAFAVELEKGYEGGALELDLFCGTVPRWRGPKPKVVPTVTLTTLQPQWRQAKDSAVAVWEYSVPRRFWCAVRGLLGAWVICGRVRHCETKAPIGGLTVRAFDVDWLQDDALGEATTDGDGHFRIDYTPGAFKKTIFPSLSLEWTSGPDLYFRVETAAGTMLLNEPRSRGRSADRENVGPCFCVDLCVDHQVPVDEVLPAFAKLGSILFATGVHSAPGGSGLTLDGRAFYGGVRLNGVLPKTMGGQPIEYRFEMCATDATGTPTGPWAPVPLEAWVPTEIGLNERLAPAFPGDPNPVKTRPVAVRVTPPVPPSPGDNTQYVTVVNGWVPVPQESDVDGPLGNFVPSGNMLIVDTAKLAASPVISVAGVIAGESSTAHGAPLSQNRHIALRLRVRQVGAPSTETNGGTCQHIAIDNTVYNDVHKQGSWVPFVAPNESCVCSIDALELRSGGCVALHSSLNVLFTSAHPNLGPVSIEMTGPGGPYGFALPPPVIGEHFGLATNNFSFDDLPNCAYIITLSTTLMLTNGDHNPLPITDRIAFCKRPPSP